MGLQMDLLFEWKHKIIKVRTLKRVPQFEDNKIIYVEKENVINIPLWMARILNEHKLVEILDEESFDFAKLDKILWKEKSNLNLQPLEDDFYIKIKEYINLLSKKIKEYPTTQSIEKKQKTETFLDDLLAYRLYKILRIVEAKNKRILMKSLTNEEKILYNNIMSYFEDWKSQILPEDK